MPRRSTRQAVASARCGRSTHLPGHAKQQDHRHQRCQRRPTALLKRVRHREQAEPDVDIADVEACATQAGALRRCGGGIVGGATALAVRGGSGSGASCECKGIKVAAAAARLANNSVSSLHQVFLLVAAGSGDAAAAAHCHRCRRRRPTHHHLRRPCPPAANPWQLSPANLIYWLRGQRSRGAKRLTWPRAAASPAPPREPARPWRV